MSRNLKMAALGAVIALVLAMPVAAQDLQGVYSEPAELESNTLAATAGVFSNDIDKSINVHDYSDVEFEKWQGFVGYNVKSGFPLSLGYARKISGGNIFLGTWYTGNVLGVYNQTTVSKSRGYDTDLQLPDGTETTSTGYGSSGHWVVANNQIAVLIGLNGMGFKVGFWESLANSKQPANLTVTESADGAQVTIQNEKAEYSHSGGHIMPSLEWGMKLNVAGKDLKPKAILALDIYNDTLINTNKGTYGNPSKPAEYSTSNGEFIGTELLSSNGHNNGYLNPNIQLGADVELSPAMTVGISYGLDFKLFSNDYTTPGYSGKTKGTVVWTNATSYTQETFETTTSYKSATLDINEQSEWNHTITPSLYFSKDVGIEGLELGLYTEIPVDISVSKSDKYRSTLSETSIVSKTPEFADLDKTTTVEKRETGTISGNLVGGLTENTSFGIAPKVSIGARYALVPGRFTVNAGAYINPFVYNRRVTKESPNGIQSTEKTTTTDKNGTQTESVTVNETWAADSVSVTNNWNYAAGGVTGGFVFYFNKADEKKVAALDMAARVGSYYTYDGGVYNASVSAPSDVLNLTTVKIMLLFKF